ncbi:outer membrane protein [Hydrogenophaga sp.]|uniref:outer membrane protein n=1 Tax=Hydrogenophaga sp. TaxID=1904254 RepID=UPI002717AF0B|nr:outer membrane beta-barrel protein [Hydrogenophaga sp.]MDO9435755.1 outer membrane beta-barrel protein [Hydrogenophaga sp.]
MHKISKATRDRWPAVKWMALLIASPSFACAAEHLPWSGCYVGVQAAAVRSQSDDWTPQSSGGAYTGQTLGGHAARGGAGGLQAGCNAQVGERFVVGVQADHLRVNAAGQHDSARETGVAYHSNVRALTSITGRAGYLMQPDLLGYAKAGVVIEHGHQWATTTQLGTAYTASGARAGWTVGLGAEALLARHWSGFLEVNFHRWGTRSIAVAPQVAGLPPAMIRITQSGTAVRAGLNYRF